MIQQVRKRGRIQTIGLMVEALEWAVAAALFGGAVFGAIVVGAVVSPCFFQCTMTGSHCWQSPIEIFVK